MNKTLLKATFKSNWGVGLIIAAVMIMYAFSIISIYDPNSLAGLTDMVKMMPKELVAAMGFEDLGTTLTTYVGNTYYNFIAILFPMIYVIIVGNRLVAKHVDSGSMAFLLSTPNSRLTIVKTQALYLLSSITAIFLLLILAAISICQAMFPGSLDIGGFLLLNLVSLLTFYAIGGITFLFSCIFNDTKQSLSFGAGVPIAFFVLNMLSNAGEQMSWLKYFTIFSLLNPTEILEKSSTTLISIIILLMISAITYTCGIVLFNRRSLPL
ncbi:ABC transporter permease subunit [Sporosalibacterium faouarense]|uniref:ABC transporter permease subunit n=1 Tax=Sporosalibacterium faouarense TaxID=516123 RepID=UPI00192A8AC1|nr:ABC transporter permease subunit [Sporosalibacterium faouarense]